MVLIWHKIQYDVLKKWISQERKGVRASVSSAQEPCYFRFYTLLSANLKLMSKADCVYCYKISVTERASPTFFFYTALQYAKYLQHRRFGNDCQSPTDQNCSNLNVWLGPYYQMVILVFCIVACGVEIVEINRRGTVAAQLLIDSGRETWGHNFTFSHPLLRQI